MTRTNTKHTRIYVDGYDLSGYIRDAGTLSWLYDAIPDACITDEVKNVLLGQPSISLGPLNAVLDGDAAGLFAALKDPGVFRYATVALGQLAAPVAGDPFFSWYLAQKDFSHVEGGGFVSVNLTFDTAGTGFTAYGKPWGLIIHPKATRTAVNTAVGIDSGVTTSSLGGIFVYHLFSSNGTITLKAQDAATNSDASFADITGATSGIINASTTPKGAMVALGVTQTIRRYWRGQLAFGTATTATFFCGLIRTT